MNFYEMNTTRIPEDSVFIIRTTEKQTFVTLQDLFLNCVFSGIVNKYILF